MLKKIDPNLLVAIGVLIASFGALFVYMRQATIMNEQTKILLEQTKASSWPHVSIGLTRTFENRELNNLKITVANKGVGPAIIAYSVVRYKDKAVQTWKEFYSSLDLREKTAITYNNGNISNTVIAANDYIDLKEWDQKEIIALLEDKLQYLSLEICYESIHGDAWVINKTGFNNNLEPTSRKRVVGCKTLLPTFKE